MNNLGKIKSEREQMDEIIAAFKEKGIEVKEKNGYGEPSNAYWSASIGKSNNKELVIK
jgi:hypothetical protein